MKTSAGAPSLTAATAHDSYERELHGRARRASRFRRNVAEGPLQARRREDLHRRDRRFSRCRTASSSD